MKAVRVAATMLPAVFAISTAAFAMPSIATSPMGTSPMGTSVGRSGKIDTEALNLLEARGYHGADLVSQNGTIVHATALTRSGKRVSVRVDTATRILLPG
jgi:hypothetical protein